MNRSEAGATEEKLGEWLGAFYTRSLTTAAVAILASTGTMRGGARALHRAGFSMPPGYFTEAEVAELGGDGGGVVFRVTGDPGVRFQGSIGNLDTTRTVQGTTPQDFKVKGVDTGMFSMDTVSGNAQKMGAGREKITVQVVVDGEVVKQASTSANYSVAQVAWSPSE